MKHKQELHFLPHSHWLFKICVIILCGKNDFFSKTLDYCFSIVTEIPQMQSCYSCNIQQHSWLRSHVAVRKYFFFIYYHYLSKIITVKSRVF